MVELFVVLAIIGILAAILLPAVQNARSAASRIGCASKLKQISLACHNYLDVHGAFPPGNLNGWSQHVLILPYIDQSQLYRQIDFDTIAWDSEEELAVFPQPLIYGCPADGEWKSSNRLPSTDRLVMTGSSYLGNCGLGAQGIKNSPGYHGLFEGNGRTLVYGIVRPKHVTDGLSQTAFWSEGLVSGVTPTRLRNLWDAPRADLFEQMDEFAKSCAELDTTGQAAGILGQPWIGGSERTTWYNHILPPNQPSCHNRTALQYGAYPPKSLHTHGVNLTYCDGSLKYFSNNVDLVVWRAISTRDGAESGFQVP